MMSALSNHLTDYIRPDQLDSYERDGFLHLKNIVSESELCLLKQAINKQKEQLTQTTTGYDFESLARQLWNDEEQIDAGDAQRFDLELYRHIIREDKTARPIREDTNQELGGKGLFFYEAAGWRKFSEIRSVAFDSIIPMICARLMDSSYINFWEDTTLFSIKITLIFKLRDLSAVSLGLRLIQPRKKQARCNISEGLINGERPSRPMYLLLKRLY